MNASGNSSNTQKIEKVTNVLWSLWWFTLFFLILPFGIAGISAFSINRLLSAISWKEELSYSVFLISVPVLIVLFLMPYEKYRKRKFFQKSDPPTIKHIILFSLLPAFPLLYSKTILIFLNILNRDYSLFFGQTGLFNQILTPLFSFLLLSYYLYTRKSSTTALFQKTIKTIDKPIILINLLVQSITIIIFPTQGLFPLLIINISVFLGSSITYYIIRGKKSVPGELSVDFRTRLLFNISTVMQLTGSLLLIGWILWQFYSLDTWIMVIQTPIILIIALKGMIIFSYNQITHLDLKEDLPSKKALLNINAILAIGVILLDIGLFVYTWNRLLFEIISVLYVLLIFIWSILDHQAKIISKTAVKIVSLGSSFLLISLIAVIPQIDIIYQVAIASVLLYIDLYLLAKWKILNKSKVAVVHAFLFSAILLEVFYALGDILIARLVPLLSDPSLEIWLRIFLFSFAFCLSTVLSLFRAVLKRFKGKVSRFIKSMFLILHMGLGITTVGIVYLSLGIVMAGQLAKFWLFFQILLPLLVYVPIATAMFGLYFHYGIYSKRGLVNIIAYSTNIFALLAGISLVVFLGSVGAYLLLGFLLTISAIIHLYIKKQNHFLEEKTYRKWLAFLHPLMLFEVNLGLLLVFVQNVRMLVSISIFTSMISTQILLLILRKFKFLFTYKFIIYYNIASMLLQVIFLPIFLDPVMDTVIVNLDIPLTGFLSSFISFLIIFVYSAVILAYSVRSGIIYHKLLLKLINLVFLGMYVYISLIPSYCLILFASIPPHLIAISHLFFTSIFLLFWIVLDTLIIHGLTIGPRIWVLHTIRYLPEEGSLSKRKIILLERATSLHLNIGEEDQVKLNTTIISEFINTPHKFYGLKNPSDKFFSHLSWIYSVVVNILTITYISLVVTPFQLTVTLALLFPSILSYATIVLLTKTLLISKKVQIALVNINFVFNVFSSAIIIFPLIQQALLPVMGQTNAILIALDCSAAFAFGSFQILKRRLMERSPGFYYITLFILWIAFSSIVIFSAAVMANVISSISALTGTLFANIFSNSVFIIFLTISFILIALLGAISYILKYNIIVLRRNPIYTVFTTKELKENGISEEEIEFFIKRGFAKKHTEEQINQRLKILRTNSFRHFIGFITYFIAPVPLFILGFLLGNFGFAVFARDLILEGIVAYLVFVLIFFSIDHRWLKLINRELNNQIRCVVWILFQALVSFSIAFILELTWYGRILLFLQVVSMLMPPLNYFLRNAGFKVIKWSERSEFATKILIIVTSTAYLANLSITTLITNLQSPDTALFGYIPFLLLAVHIAFHITYLRKETSLKRYYRTSNRSYPYIMISLYLIRYQGVIFSYIPTWQPILVYILPIISVVAIWWALFYYYSMVRQFNIIMNFLYQLLLIYIGFLFMHYLVSIPFSTLLTYDHLATDQFLVSCGITFLVFYYLRKAAYFEIYKGFLDEEPIRFRAVGIIAGVIRSIGVVFLIGVVFRIVNSIWVISITRWAMGSFSLNQLNLINSTFIWSISSFVGLFLFLFFLRGYFKNFAQFSYNSRFVVRIWTVLAAANAVAMCVILYEPIFFYALPPILVGCYFWLYMIQKKNPYRANLTIGIGKAILVFLFVFWVLHQYIFNLILGHLILDPSLLLPIELLLSGGITGFVFSRTFQNIIIKGKKFLTWAILVSSVGVICYSTYLTLINLGILIGNPSIDVGLTLSLTITMNFGILLLYLAVAIQQWKISKKIWEVGWWLWLFLPLINFTLIYRSISGVDTITQTFAIFSFEIPGSILLTIIITTLLYLPVILTKFQKAYKFFFFITWIEAIPVWIWLAPNLFSSQPSIFLSPLFVIGLSLISLVPFLFSLKYWKLIAGAWVIIAIINAIFLSILLHVDFIPDVIMDIFIHICIYGLYLIIFLSNPVIKESWKRYDYGILLGFILLTAGASILVFGFAYVLLDNYLYAISISGFITGSIMISGRYVKIIQNKINPFAILFISTSLGFGSFIFLFNNQIFPVSMDYSWQFLNELLHFTQFPFSFAIVSSCGVLLLAQAQQFISKKRWRLVYAIFALGIGFALGSILDSLLGISNPLFAVTVSFWATMALYPTFRWKKSIFWGIFPVFLAYSVLLGFEELNIALNLQLNQKIGINYTLWIFSFSLFSLLVHKMVSRYYIQKHAKITRQLNDMGITDFETVSFAEEQYDDLMEQQQQIADKLIHSYHVLPRVYISPKNVFILYSCLLTIMQYSGWYLVGFMVPLDLYYQIQIFLFGISISTFITLNYNKRKAIFGNPQFIRTIRFTASNLLYASILYGIIILNQFIVPVLLFSLSFISITPSLIVYLKMSLDGLFFHLIFLVLTKWVKFYGRKVTLLVKILSWITFLTGLGLFIGNIISYMFAVILTLTVGSYIIVLHLRHYHNEITTNLRLLAKSVSSELKSDQEIQEDLTNEDVSVYENSLGLDIPIPINPPAEIHHEDLVSEANFVEVKDVLDNLHLPSGVLIPESSSEPEIIIEQQDPQQYLNDTLLLIAKQEKRNKILKSLINHLDAWIKQGVILEISYFVAIILSNLLPGIGLMPLYHVYVFKLGICAFFATIFYNIKKLVPTGYRLVMVQIILSIFSVLTIILPISIISVYGVRLHLIGDGNFAPVGQLYLPNVIFLSATILFLLLLQTQLIVYNYTLTKNVHLRKSIMDKWNDILQPILLILAAFIIANSISFNQTFITRVVYASGVLFVEALLEKYISKIFNRLTRARILLYSWILISLLGIIQMVIILPSLVFPISLGVLALVALLFAQFITLFLIYQLKNEKTIRNYQIDPKVLDHPKFRIFSRISRFKTSKLPLTIEKIEYSTKLITYKEYITPKYNFIASMAYILVSFLIAAVVYESFLFQFISNYMQQLSILGISISNFTVLWNNPIGITYILFCSIPLSIAIVGAFLLFYQDRFTFKFIKIITRDSFLILLWLAITADLLFYALAFIQYLEGIPHTDLIVPGIISIISIAQYYTIYLISDIAIHSAKMMNKLESIYPEVNLESQTHSQLMKLLSQFEPKSLKIVKTINVIFALGVYCTISVVAYILIYILTSSVIISLTVAFLIMYGQAELNNYVLKAFPEKFNFFYSMISWIGFSLVVSLLLPISMWNSNFIWSIMGEQVKFTNMFYLLAGMCIFSVLSYVTIFIMKRSLPEYDIKYVWMKYLRMITYFFVTVTVFVLFVPTLWLFALFVSSVILYFEMVFERYMPVFMDKTTRLIRSIAAFSMSVIASYCTYNNLQNNFDFELALAVSILLFTLLSQLIFNFWEYKKIAGPIYWAFISSEVGYLISISLTNGVLIGIGSGIFLMVLYPVIFEFNHFIEFFENLAENMRIMYQKILYFFNNFWAYMKNFYIKFKIPITLVMVVAIFTIIFLVIRSFLPIYQAIFISAAIASTFLFPIFITPKSLKDEKKFSRMVYYSAIVYVFANIAIFSFIKPNIIWFLLSLVLFSSILLVVIYRRETLYNLSIRWRFIGLIITILSALALVTIVVLYFLNIIPINF